MSKDFRGAVKAICTDAEIYRLHTSLYGFNFADVFISVDSVDYFVAVGFLCVNS